MGRSPCCSKEGLNRGAWTETEDRILREYVETHGHGKWRNVSKSSGLKRCGKSCRLRWLNYLRPGIKRGNVTRDEEDLIKRLHKLLGNRWSLIAGRLPHRTDNEIKNYWNTKIRKEIQNPTDEKSLYKSQEENQPKTTALLMPDNADSSAECTMKQLNNNIPANTDDQKIDAVGEERLPGTLMSSISLNVEENNSYNQFEMDDDDQFLSDILNLDFSSVFAADDLLDP